MKVLITGGNGYIAKALYTSLKELYDVTAISRSDFDLSCREQTCNYFKDKFFDVVIHTAIKGGSRLHKDAPETTHYNLSMFYNLLANKASYAKLINIGSGAEEGIPTTPYGLSKSIISKLVESELYFYNIRVYAVFDENELSTRFIKANIIRYCNNESILIDQDKYMDFYYMKDLISVVDYYIRKNPKYELCPKLFNCSYKYHLTLGEIAAVINTLGDHEVDIVIKDRTFGTPYTGSYTMPEIENTSIPYIPTIGLVDGIKKVYNALNHNQINKTHDL
jgi:UDP-glucose 4-epimerase